MSSDCPPRSRPFVLRLLALRKKLGQKQISGPITLSSKQVSKELLKEAIDDETFQQLLAGVRGTPAEVAVATFCAEAFDALERPSNRSLAERELVELGLLELARSVRRLLYQIVDDTHIGLPLTDYPRPGEVEPARWEATRRLELLKEVPTPLRLRTSQELTPLHTWAMVELAAEESVQAASRDLEEAFLWARIARQIAKKVRGSKRWRLLLQAYALASYANAQRVAGRLRAADRTLEAAKRLWHKGVDPDQVLDPGRLLDLEASLRRDQRRLSESLACLDEARLLSHHPARILIIKAFTLEVMGDYQRAIDALLEAEPLLEEEQDPRLWYNHRINWAVLKIHLGDFAEAAELASQIRDLAEGLDDKIFLLRVLWLEGRIAAGQGRSKEALQRLEEAERGFAANRMWYDSALALLEREALLLEEGGLAEVKAASLRLVAVFEAKGVHREALAALRLFYEAAQNGTATAQLARHMLRYLSRARYDRDLHFSS